MEYAIAFTSIMIGMILAIMVIYLFRKANKDQPIGTLKLETDPDDGSTYLFLELDRPEGINAITRSDRVIFRVDLGDEYATRD